MANFDKAYEIMVEAEYSNNPEKFLHGNKFEKSATLGGIYRHANPTAIDWDFVDSILQACNHDFKRASKLLYADDRIQTQVYNFFKKHYWDSLRLGEIHSQIIANEIYLFGVVAGIKTAAKTAQRVVGAKVDGIIGDISIKCLNIYNETRFDEEFDEAEKRHFELVAEKNPNLKMYLNGWLNRSVLA